MPHPVYEKKWHNQGTRVHLKQLSHKEKKLKPSFLQKKKKKETKELGLNGTSLRNNNLEGWKTIGHEFKILRV